MERQAKFSAGDWLMFWGMLFLALWMAPVPTPAKISFARATLAVVGAYLLIITGLRVRLGRAERWQELAGFTTGAGALALAAGLGQANAPFGVPIDALRIALQTIAAGCLLLALALHLRRNWR